MTEDKDNLFKQMPLGDHLEELRSRIILAFVGLIIGFAVCLFAGQLLVKLITIPYESGMKNAGLVPKLIAIEPPEKFLVFLKTSLLFGLILSCPWIFYQMWAFVSAGLYEHERKYVYIITPVSAALFITGALFFITVVGPLVMRFFITFDPGPDYVEVNFTLSRYVNFIIMLTLVFGAAFQMPIFIIALERLGIISVAQLCAVRKYVIISLFIIAAIATPPDVVSQVALAIPLYFLYEGSIIVCTFLNRKKKN